MRRDSPARTLAWMATGAAMVAVGALLGSSSGRRKSGASSPLRAGGLPGDTFEDLEDRPVAQAVLAESVAAARRADALAGAVAGLEARVQSIERLPSAERIDAIWQRVLQVEQRIEQIRNQRLEIPSIEVLVSQAESRLSPRIHAIEIRVEEHQAAIRQLQTQAAQTEVNLQKMIAAVEKLTDQISRVLPGAATRMEPKREATFAAPPSEAGALQPVEQEREGGRTGAAPLESHGEREKTVPFRWKSLALAVAIALSLGGSWAAVRPEPGPGQALAATAPASSPSLVAPAEIDSAMAVLSRLAAQQPEEAEWKIEIGASLHDEAGMAPSRILVSICSSGTPPRCPRPGGLARTARLAGPASAPVSSEVISTE